MTVWLVKWIIKNVSERHISGLDCFSLQRTAFTKLYFDDIRSFSEI